MKKNTLLKLAGALLVLTLITTTLVSGTFAKYVTSVEATDTVTVAKWVANLQGNAGTGYATNTTTFNFFDTAWVDSGVNGKRLAPGTEGSFGLVYDTNGSQVARNVTITLDASSVLSTLPQLKFYSDAAHTPANEIVPNSGVLTVMNTDFGPTATGSGTATVYWAWSFTGNDVDDTADGVTPLTGVTLTATFTATQLDTYVP